VLQKISDILEKFVNTPDGIYPKSFPPQRWGGKDLGMARSTNRTPRWGGKDLDRCRQVYGNYSRVFENFVTQ